MKLVILIKSSIECIHKFDNRNDAASIIDFTHANLYANANHRVKKKK